MTSRIVSKFSLLCHQAEMVFIIVWFLDHLALEYVPSMNSIWIITPASLLHVWVTKFKTSLIFFKLSILTSNNVIWVGLLAILFNEAEHVVKIFATGYMPAFYQVINLFIKLQNFLLMFFICRLKGFYLIVTTVMACRCFPWISSSFASNPRGTMSFRMCSLSTLPLSFLHITMT